MSIDELYGKRSYIQGCIFGCEKKYEGLNKTKDRLEKEREDLEEDKKKAEKIVKKAKSIIPYLQTASNYTLSSREIISSYYNGNQTPGWRKSLKLTANSIISTKTSLESIQKSGNETIGELEKEKRKKETELEKVKGEIKSAEDELKGLYSDLYDVQYDIEHYDYDDE